MQQSRQDDGWFSRLRRPGLGGLGWIDPRLHPPSIERHSVQKRISTHSFVLPSLIVGLVLVAIATFCQPAPAWATVRVHQEAPDQVLYQSRQSLRDRQRQTWQAIAFKRVSTTGESSLYLRIIGFPDRTLLEQNQPLLLQDMVGQTWAAESAITEIFTQGPPAANVGQYRLDALIAQLQPGSPYWLMLPGSDGQPVELKAPPIVVQEWQAIAQCHTFTCQQPDWQYTPYHDPAAAP